MVKEAVELRLLTEVNKLKTSDKQKVILLDLLGELILERQIDNDETVKILNKATEDITEAKLQIELLLFDQEISNKEKKSLEREIEKLKRRD